MKMNIDLIKTKEAKMSKKVREFLDLMLKQKKILLCN